MTDAAGAFEAAAAAEVVARAREVWIRRLIDQSRNNSLLFYRPLKVSTLDLTASPTIVGDLLAGNAIDLTDIVAAIRAVGSEGEATLNPQRASADLRERIRHSLVAIQRKAKDNQEEKGLETLFLALGQATWPAEDGGRPYDAPILLYPARVFDRGQLQQDLRIQLHGDPQPNLVLVHVLNQYPEVGLDPEDIIRSSAVEDERGGWRVDTARAYAYLSRATVTVRGIEFNPRTVLGNFQFAKMAMVEDIKRHATQMESHALIRAIAGDAPSRRELEPGEPDFDPRSLDTISPDQEFQVLSADSSQQHAIVLAARGENGVIQGPPGTGKSQTIANLITQLSAEGKRVLFVAEKRAALDAVIKRLKWRGLGHLTLDLHGAAVSRKEVMSRIAAALDAIRQSVPVDSTALHRDLESQRSVLTSHLQLIHKERRPTGKSIFEMYELVSSISLAGQSRVRWRGAACLALSEDRVAASDILLTEAAKKPSLFLGNDPSPWNNAAIYTGSDAQLAIDRVDRIVRTQWAPFSHSLDEVLREAHLRSPDSLEECRSLSRLLQQVVSLLDHYSAEIFSVDLDDLMIALAPASRGRIHTVWAFLTNPAFRKARKRLLSLRTAKAASSILGGEVGQAKAITLAWRNLWKGPGTPAVPKEQATFRSHLSILTEEISALDQILYGQRLFSIALSSCRSTLDALAADRLTPFMLPRVHELRRLLTTGGMGELISELVSTPASPDLWPNRLQSAWLHSAIELAQADDPALATFNGRSHDEAVNNFRRLDHERIHLAVARVRRLHGEAATAAMNQFPEQTELVRREAKKRARHIPLRQLLAEAPDVLTRLAPCWVASPLSVSQLLDGSQRHFDVVIFDEASQILPEEAIPSLFRAGQVVVAGDSQQLPPTTFFATQADVDDEEIEEDKTGALDAITGFESLLDILSVFTSNWMLEWHYRSEDERLIAFSNHFIYDGRLVTFPSAKDFSPISHTLVGARPALGGQDESASAEVEEVVRQVIAHAESAPKETLGVITMGVKHANRVQAALDRALMLRPDLGHYFNQEKEERFFVKNLETVQGDERDAIILTIGYGKTPEGDLPHRFGPLTQDVGYRRLNVAITRARRRMAVVSSFSHLDVDLSRSASKGVRLLKGFLEYAAGGARSLPGSEEVGKMPLNSFEADIKNALEARGIPILPQYGVSRFCIDLVAMHPEKRGLPVLAIECDGKAYHSSATARDRDRLRQEQLMRQGWQFHRIWSTDWFYHREEEIERAVVAYNDAVGRSNPRRPDGPPPVTPKPTPIVPPVPSRSAAFPRIRLGAQIGEYSDRDLRGVVDWIMSDGLLRTDVELMREILATLGLRRLGDVIRRRLENAVESHRHRGRELPPA